MSRTPREPGQRAVAREGLDLPETAQCSVRLRGCEGRGELKLDPYQYDVENRMIRRYLCDRCEQELADDI